MTKTKAAAIILVLICTVLTSIAQIFYKLAGNKLSFDFYSILTNYYIYIGLVIYAIAAVLLIYALKNGELSVIYPMISTSYIWVILLSYFIFSETINAFKWIGVFIIIIGVGLLSRG